MQHLRSTAGDGSTCVPRWLLRSRNRFSKMWRGLGRRFLMGGSHAICVLLDDDVLFLFNLMVLFQLCLGHSNKQQSTWQCCMRNFSKGKVERGGWWTVRDDRRCCQCKQSKCGTKQSFFYGISIQNVILIKYSLLRHNTKVDTQQIVLNSAKQ